MRAGQLTRRVVLLSPVESRDADGQIVQSYEDRGAVWGNVLPLKGGEAVMQARMQSRSPAIITVPASSLTQQVTAEWLVAVGGRRFAVREQPRETQDRAFLEFLVEGRGDGDR